MEPGGEHKEQWKKYNTTMNSLAYGNVMQAAARNLKKEMEENNNNNKPRGMSHMNMKDLEDDEELEQLHRDRMQAMKREQEKRTEMANNGHGSLTDINEENFLGEVTQSALVCCHFYHHEFERCRILDKHLAALAPKYFETKFIRIHAPDAAFFVHKLQVQVLPCLVLFRDGIAFDRIVGFEELMGKDDFKTCILEGRLFATGILKMKVKTEDDSDDEIEHEQRNRGIRTGGTDRPKMQLGSDDEDSDFSD